MSKTSSQNQLAANSANKGQPVDNPIPSLLDHIYQYAPNIPDNVSTLHREIMECVARVANIDQSITAIQNKLNPISRANRKRGKRPEATIESRAFLKASLVRLKKQRFIESNDIAEKKKRLNDLTKSDISRTRSSFIEEKARSERYLRKNKAYIVVTAMQFLNQLQSSNSSELVNLKNRIRLRNDQSIQFLRDFLNENDSTRFLSTAFNSHEKFRQSFLNLFRELLNDWTTRARSYDFNTVTVDFNLTTHGE